MLIQLHKNNDGKESSFSYDLTATCNTSIIPDRLAKSYSGRALTQGNRLELRHITIEDVRITSVRVTIRILPDSLIAPVSGDGTWPNVIVCSQDQGTSGTERGGIARAGAPPVICGVNEWVNAFGIIVGVDEVADPAHHLAS